MAGSAEERACPFCGGRIVPAAEELLDGGPLSFVKEVRAPQIEVARLIEKSIGENKAAIIEAATGTGKAFGYAIPVALSGKNAVISTATINLQNQLIQKDLPAVQKEMQKHGVDFTFAIAKGKSNYVCGVAVEETTSDTKDPKKYNQSFKTWAKQAVAGSGSADKATYTGELPKNWADITAEECSGQSCPHFTTCGYIKAKLATKQAKIRVANHAVVGMDLAFSSPLSPNPILGKYEILVLDEAHNAVNYFRNAFAAQASLHDLRKVATLLNKRGIEYNGAHYSQMLSAAKDAFKQLPEARGQFELIDEARRQTPALKQAWTDFEAAVKIFEAPISGLFAQLGGPGKILNASEAQDRATIQRARRRINRVTDAFSRLLTTDATQKSLTSFVRDQKGEKELVCTPLDLGPFLAAKLYSITPCVIATSATITVGGSFDYIKRDLGLQADADHELRVKSPFDYEKNAVLYMSQHIPEPKASDGLGVDTEYADALSDEIHKLLLITGGRAFILFTAKTEMEAVQRRLALRGHNLLVQDGLTTPPQLVAQYLESAKAGRGPVLLGLRSFYEGVSIEGDDLSLVVITKLPFPAMSDPLYKAQCEVAGDKSFQQVTIPAMIKDLQQGAGRLIRTTTDIGIVAILDRRVIAKPYGSLVRASLPFSVRSTDLQKVENWFRSRSAQKKESLSSTQ